MKILLISSAVLPVPCPGYGGLEMVLFDLAIALRDLGHKVSVLAVSYSKLPADIEFIDGGEAGKTNEAMMLDIIRKRIHQNDWDIIHDHSWQKIIYLDKKNNPNLKVIATLHGMNPYGSPPPVQYPNMVCLSKDHALRTSGALGINTRWVYNGLNTEFYRFNPRKGDRMLFLGRFMPGKGAHIAVDIANRLKIPLDLCIPKGFFVNTDKTIKDISEVSKNENVLSHDGCFYRVEETFKRFYKGNIIEIVPQSIKIPIQLTPNHPVLVLKGVVCKGNKSKICRPSFNKTCKRVHCNKKDAYKPEWVPAEKISKNDFLLYPIVQDNDKIPYIEINDYLPESFVKDGFILTFQTTRDNNLAERKKTPCHQQKKIPNKIFITPDFLRLCGYYISDGGTVGGNSISFSFNAKEKEYADDVCDIMNKSFGVNCRQTIDRETTLSVRCNSSIIVSLFKKLFGENALNKCIPGWIMKFPKEDLNDFIIGLFRGDGWTSTSKTRGFNYKIFNYGTSSKILSSQLTQLLIKMGYLPRVIRYMQPEKSYSKTKRHFYRIEIPENRLFKKRSVFVFDKKYIAVPVREIKSAYFEGDVYNLKVNSSNSYVCEGVAVHNCGDDTMVIEKDYVKRIMKSAMDSNGLITYWGPVPRERAVEFFGNARMLLQCGCGGWIEPFGLITIESLCCGTPVVALDNGATREIINKDIKSGFICNNPDEIVELIKSGEVDKIKPEDCRKRGEQFNRKFMAQNYMTLYNEIMEGREW